MTYVMKKENFEVYLKLKTEICIGPDCLKANYKVESKGKMYF